MERPGPTADLSSAHLLNESFSCFEDEDEADLQTASEANHAEEDVKRNKSNPRFVRPLIATLILGAGAIIAIIAYAVTKRQDERLCQEAATEGAESMQIYVENTLRTTIDASGFASTSGRSDHCNSSWPVVMSVLIAICHLVAAAGFVWYDRRQQRKYDKAQDLAERTTSLVASLYPKQVRDRLLNQERAPKTSERGSKDKGRIPFGNDDMTDSPSVTASADQNPAETTNQAVEALDTRSGHSPKPPLKRTESALSETDDIGTMFTSRPIADLFPETTLLFADIAGFTAWSSARQPTEVFMLLETLYGNFDIIAKKWGIFKVETIGDCYVAASGIPSFKKTHCVDMCRFARDCLVKTKELVKKLEKKLGPDTTDLHMRMGLHSGPVTGGVLRGEKSRFQLFGDSMNTCARIETSGMKGRVHLSQSTADALLASGKANWFYAREEKVYAKGKGELQTYWLKVGKKHNEKSKLKSKSRIISDSKLKDIKEEEEDESDSTWSDSDYDSDDSDNAFDSEELLAGLVSEKTSRLIDWNVSNMTLMLKEIVAARSIRGISSGTTSLVVPKAGFRVPLKEELTDSIDFHPLERKPSPAEIAAVELDRSVVAQLHDLVTNIAIMYKDNEYNNFERASQTLLAVTKFIARVDENAMSGVGRRFSADPLAIWACAFSCYHPGVSNAVFINGQEHTKMVKGEQNSFDLAFGLLMDDTYSALRAALFASQHDATRFRQMVINFVVTAHISDKTQLVQRNKRWEQAVHRPVVSVAEQNYIATRICELMMQAVDVAHAMQHSEVYKKWNERLYLEQHTAFRRGQAEDPAVYWYASQLETFDMLVVPLAEKLSACGVFGSLGGECLSYAVNNRQDWQATGKQSVETMAGACRRASNTLPLQLAKAPIATKSTAPTASVDRKLSDVAKKTTNSNLGAAMSSLMDKVSVLQHAEERMASSGDQSSVIKESPHAATDPADKNLSGIARRSTSSNMDSAMNRLMSQVTVMQKMEEQIASTSTDGNRASYSPSETHTTSEGDESSSSDGSSSVDDSIESD